MLLFNCSLGQKESLAFITDSAVDAVAGEIATAALQDMRYVARVGGARAFWILLQKALADATVSAVAISLNGNCVLDDELPDRLKQACSRAAGGADWAVLAATGSCPTGNIYSVAYASASPRLFSCSIPRPIVDCGLELFVINADFLRSQAEKYSDGEIPYDCFGQWCILEGYIQGRLSVFRPEMAIGVNGPERGRDPKNVARVLQMAFGERLPDDVVPSLMGNVPIPSQGMHASAEAERNPRNDRLNRAVTPLIELFRQAAQAVTTPMSLTVVTRTRFSRDHLLRRMLASLIRARHDLDISLEVVLTTDIIECSAREAYERIKAEFPELDLVLQINHGMYPHSRVDNLMGGILAAGRDYVAVIDDDDFVDFDAFRAISTARFLGQKPLLLMSSQVRNEAWRESSAGRWILESSRPSKTYSAKNCHRMFSGINQLPVCAMIAPRVWMQDRLRNITLRHDLSEDYTLYLALLTAPDLPPLMVHEDIFCMISSRTDGSNTITMEDRRPWVRDITLFVHDMFIASPIPGAGVAQILARCESASRDTGRQYATSAAVSDDTSQAREIALLKAEVAHLRSILVNGGAAGEEKGQGA